MNKRKDEKVKIQIFSKIATIISSIVSISFASLLVFILIVENINIINKRPESSYQVISNYSLIVEEDSSYPAGVKKEYHFVIDDIEDNDSLAFYTIHQYSEVYIDGELVYRINGNNLKFIDTIGSNWVMIRLKEGDIGKEIVIKITPVYKSFVNREIEILCGNELAIYSNRLEKDFIQLFLSVLALFIGIIFSIIGIWQMIKLSQGKELTLLGIFSIMAGLWRFTDTRFTPFIFPNKPTFVFYLSIVMLILGCIPLIKAIGHQYNKKSKRILDGCIIAIATVSLIQFLLQIFSIMDIRENLIVTHIMIFIIALIALSTSIYNTIKSKNQKKKRVINMLPFVCAIGIVADVIAYYVKSNSSNLIFTLLGFEIYIIFEGIILLIDYSERGKKIALQEKELLQSQVNLMMSQIKPHFVYNSLTSIGELCITDPNKARDALMDFSNYLRKNMEYIDASECVLFSEELKYVETYLNLEKIRFGDRITINYLIEESNFYIPPLTIQPIVENAVKHGICKKKEGGSIYIKTRKEDDKIVIEISDDGIGFDLDSISYNGDRSHIGIFNVKFRLEQMINGTLNIISEKSKGTTVIIVVPINS
ncbi:MAG: histidine kinase [Bacilli bacterium]|nr:histidine kinase [Bacillales bacterium]MDY2574547.1 histidine kinase [Bacilli bacterium]